MKLRFCVAALVALVSAGCCETTKGAQVASPDGKHIAVVYQRSCGATVNNVVSVYIDDAGLARHLRHSRPPVLRSDGYMEDVTVKWVSATELLVRYQNTGNLHRKETSSGGVSIRYEPS